MVATFSRTAGQEFTLLWPFYHAICNSLKFNSFYYFIIDILFAIEYNLSQLSKKVF